MVEMKETETAGNVTELPNKAAIREQAAAWLVRIDSGELSQTEIAELRLWCGRSELHRQALHKLAANWDAMGNLQVLAEVFPLPDAEPRCAQGRVGRVTRVDATWYRPATWVAAAATLLVAAVVGLGMLPNLWSRDELSTEVGEQASFTLKDGSVIALNTNSRLKVDYTDERRTITLIRGEATFDVAKNPERPFVVYAGGGMVWAVGTAFNVRFLDDEVDVTVTEGRVKVFSDTRARAGPTDLEVDVRSRLSVAVVDERIANDDTEALIGAGETLRYSGVIKTVEPIPEEALTRKLAWRQGALIFKGESLEQAVAEIARYTDREIVISDPALRALSVGGHYKTDDINALFTTLEQGLAIRVEYAANNRIVLTSIR